MVRTLAHRRRPAPEPSPGAGPRGGRGEWARRREAERVFRKAREAEEVAPRPLLASRVTIDEAADSLRRKLAMRGSRKSYLEGGESMQRVHIVPGLDNAAVAAVERRDVEALAEAMLKAGRAQRPSATSSRSCTACSSTRSTKAGVWRTPSAGQRVRDDSARGRRAGPAVPGTGGA